MRIRFRGIGSAHYRVDEHIEAQERNIKSLYEELKEHSPGAKLGYVRQEFPLKFGMDDIIVLPASQQSEIE